MFFSRKKPAHGARLSEKFKLYFDDHPAKAIVAILSPAPEALAPAQTVPSQESGIDCLLVSVYEERWHSPDLTADDNYIVIARDLAWLTKRLARLPDDCRILIPRHNK